jgi:hypothetical protein
MFNHLILATQRKKMSLVKKRRNVDFTKGSVRQIIYRRYSRDKIHAVELEVEFCEYMFLNYYIIIMLTLLLDFCTICLWVIFPTFWSVCSRHVQSLAGNTAHIHKMQKPKSRINSSNESL